MTDNPNAPDNRGITPLLVAANAEIKNLLTNKPWNMPLKIIRLMRIFRRKPEKILLKHNYFSRFPSLSNYDDNCFI